MKKSVRKFFVPFAYIALLLVSVVLSGCKLSGNADTDVLQDAQAQQATPAPEPAATPPVEATPAPVQEQPPAAVKMEEKPQEPVPSEPKQTETLPTAPPEKTSVSAARQKLEQAAASKTTSSESKENVIGVGTLNIVSLPSGAKIGIDGQDRSITGFFYGVTPHTIRNVAAGDRKILLQKAGYQDYTMTVFLPPGRHIEIEATLAKKK